MGDKQINYANWPSDYGDPRWFISDRFGMFIHFGLFSAVGKHEWIMTFDQMSEAEYKDYFDHFNPDLFDPKDWAKKAKQAGMKYVVFTTKHHEGFALWDTKQSDYKVTNTAFGRDLLREVIEAFRAEGIRIGLYFSIIDWHHPDFPLDGFHPDRDRSEHRVSNDQRDMEKYNEFMYAQIRELMSDYGRIDYLWFDFVYDFQDWGWSKGKGKDDFHSEKIEQMVRELQPHILMNNRLGLNRGVVTPEQYQPQKPLYADGQPVLWEACQTFNGSWGYDRDNLDWKSSELLIKTLIDTVSKGGNLLLNVGPNGRGEFDERTNERLAEIGEWMKLHNRSIYDCRESDYISPKDCRYTQNGNKLYVHIFSWPLSHLHLPGLSGKVAYAQFLHDGSKIDFVDPKTQEQYKSPDTLDKDTIALQVPIDENDIILNLPIQRPDVIVPVVELFLEEE